MKDIYLSIDLDYWSKFQPSSNNADQFFNHVFNLNLPYLIVLSHEKLLPHIKQSGCRSVFNVDHHSDLADFKPGEQQTASSLNEGTWGNFVSFRRKGGAFVWLAPSRHCFQEGEGYCHIHKDPFLFPNVRSGWVSARKEIGWEKNIPWHRVKAVGISLSLNMRCKEETEYDWLKVAPVLNVLRNLELITEPLMLQIEQTFYHGSDTCDTIFLLKQFIRVNKNRLPLKFTCKK